MTKKSKKSQHPKDGSRRLNTMEDFELPSLAGRIKEFAK
jgi:hypothetical protein